MHTMARRQIEFVLSRNNVGRVAFVSDRVEIRPVHYVYYAGALYGRTTFETKGLTWLMQPEVAFEVDEVRSLFDWRSIVVHGRVSLLQRDGPPEQSIAYWAAVDAIRTLIPAAFMEGDPTPDRTVVFRIDPHEMTGREASTH
jgi:nitroimidazol reductase NimA-like FMN-containing flavoprotein (pyridoxamine 5'-phosphate oxidase superfamily)